MRPDTSWRLPQIATKVELHAGVPEGPGMAWTRLGSFSFDSNKRTHMQARELKSVTVNVRATQLRIVLTQCHANTLNAYHQVPRTCHASCSMQASLFYPQASGTEYALGV